MLVQRVGQAGLRLGEAALAVGKTPFPIVKVLITPVELVEPAGDLLFLLDDPALDLLDLLLPGAALLLQLGAGAEGHLLGLELGPTDLGLGLARLGLGVPGRLVHRALGVLHDAAGAGLGIADGTDRGDLLTQIPNQEGEDCYQGEEQQHQIHRSLLPGRARTDWVR